MQSDPVGRFGRGIFFWVYVLCKTIPENRQGSLPFSIELSVCNMCVQDDLGGAALFCSRNSRHSKMRILISSLQSIARCPCSLCNNLSRQLTAPSPFLQPKSRRTLWQSPIGPIPNTWQDHF